MKFMKRTTTSDVLAGFSKMVKQLESIASREDTERQNKLAQAGALLTDAEGHKAEGEKARAAAAKLNEFIGG